MNDQLIKVNTTCDVVKNIDEDERLFTAVVLRGEVIDAHGDYYSKDVVKQACHDFTTSFMNANIQHQLDVSKEDMAFVESYIAPCDIEFDKGTAIQGDWILVAKIHDDNLWKSCLDGEFTGFSVGCTASIEVVQENEEN